jgi:hypothetical protein
MFRWRSKSQLEDKRSREMEAGPKTVISIETKPRYLTPDGNPCFGAEEDYHFSVFELFRGFGDFFNSWRSSTAFRLRELQDTKITYRDLDLGPNYGHRYNVYHDQFKVGLLQISASRVQFSRSDGLTFSETVQQIDHLEVHVNIFLDPFSTTTMSFKEVKAFLEAVAQMTTSATQGCSYTGYEGITQRQYVKKAIETAMQEALWNSHLTTSDRAGPSLHLFFAGLPTDWYGMPSSR